jgi:plasmid stabilization system protein ParE
MVELRWQLTAESDLDAIIDYISRDSPVNAALFVRRIVAAAERLREHPDLGRVIPELGDPRTVN